MYQLREVILKNGPHERKVLVIDFTDPEMAIVGEFLMADANLLSGKVLEEIDHVLKGERDVVKTSGNRCALEIKADKTQINDLFDGMDGVDAHTPVEIETKKLRELIVMWLDKMKEFKK